MPLEEFASLLQTLGRGNFKDSEKLTNSIKKAIRNSYRLKQMTQESINIILGVLVFQIRGIEKSINELDEAIERLVEVIPEYQCLTSIPGIGRVYAAGLLAEIGQVERFEGQTKLAKYAGNQLANQTIW